MLREIKSDTYRLYFNDLAIVPPQKIAYGSCAGFNGLFEIELESGKCKYIGLFPNEDLTREFIHLSAVYCRRKAFFFPQRGKYISVYDMDRRNIVQIDFKECDAPYFSKNYKVGQVFAHKNKVLAVGATYPYVLVINADTLETNFIPMETKGRPVFFRTGGRQVGGRWYIPSLKGGIILEIDPDTEQIKSHFWGMEEDGAWSMAFAGERFWLTPHVEGEGFRVWEPGKGIVRQIADFPEGYRAGELPYVHCVCVDQKILCPPFDANMMVELDTRQNRIKKVEQSIFQGGKISGISFRAGFYIFVKIRNGEESWYEQTGRDFCVDMRTMEPTEYQFVFCGNREQFSQDVAKRIRESSWWSGMMRENEKFGLEEYLRVLLK